MARVTMTASWRCRCGVSLRIVAIEDSEKAPSAQIATCPTCGDEQKIYADKIVSVEAVIAAGVAATK